ncbi:MAG: Trm112 family protein [Candidatus Tectomicrobia bacterium]|nr:Trm112 family protein [Candidatus Tectomicrobia bacterium]
MALDKDLLDILACPKCKGDLEYRQAENQLVCHACRLIYEIKDDIPIMLIDEAKPLEA